MTHHPSALDPLLRQRLDVLPQPPIQIAEGLILVDYDIDENMTGWLLVSLWGRKLELFSARAGVFEGQISTALVDLGPRGAFFLEHVSIAIERRPLPDATAIEIAGRGRLELRGLATGDSNPLVVQGTLRLVHAEGTGEKYLRLDLLPTRISFPIADGVIFSFLPERLFFIDDDAGTIDIEMRAQCSFAGLPHFLQDGLGNDVIAVDVRVTPDGMSLHAATVHDQLRLVCPSLPALGSLPEFHPGEFVASIRHLRVDIGEQIVGRVDVVVQVPHVFHDLVEPRFSVRILTDASGVQVRLLSSPLRLLKIRPRARESLDARVDLGRYGQLSFALPVLRFDATTGNLVAEGSISYEDLRIPLGPLITFLARAGQQRIAERLPESIAVQPFGLANVTAALTNLFRLALGDGAIAEKAYEELNSLVEKMDRQPLVTAHYGQSKPLFYTSERASTAITYRDLCSTTVAMNISVEAEFFAKVSTSLTGTFTTQSEVEQVAATEKKTSSSIEYTVLSGQVGLVVSPVDVFMHSGKAWFAPTAPASFVIANCNAYWQLKEKFPNKRLWDFTRTMDIQAPVLSGKGLDAFGAICYQFPSDDEVTIYQNGDYQGRASSFAPGRYNVDSLGWVGNDQASSVKVPSGFKVTLFEHADWSGRSKVFTSSANYIGDDFNDRVSSLIVEKI